MKLSTRAIIVLALLGTAALAHGAMRYHLNAPGPLEAVELEKPLDDFPYRLGPWVGVDREEPESVYGDQFLSRNYVNRDTRQVVAVWMAYSRHGEDRGHNPEVCMILAGKPEDRTVRQSVEVPGHAAPVQQYRYGWPGDRQWVFYWYYTLVPSPAGEMTVLQRLYQRLHYRPASITIEVFSPEQIGDDGQAGREFVRLLDEALQDHLGETAVRGSRRLPVELTYRPEEGER